MGFWGKIIGGAAGFAMGGPPGMLIGAALGHAADTGAIGVPFGADPTRLAGMLGNKEQVFAVNVVVLAAKLARCDGPIQRAEIDAFKRAFRIPPESARDIGRLFDQARDNPEQYAPYATQIAQAFRDDPQRLEATLFGLFAIARADTALNRKEEAFLLNLHGIFGLDQPAWDRASGATPPQSQSNEPDPYTFLGVSPEADNKELRETWRQLMRENHPDSLAARGVPAAVIASAGDKVARINAAWDRIKRERGL